MSNTIKKNNFDQVAFCVDGNYILQKTCESHALICDFFNYLFGFLGNKNYIFNLRFLHHEFLSI